MPDNDAPAQEVQKPAEVNFTAPRQLPKQDGGEVNGFSNKSARVLPQDNGQTPLNSKFAKDSGAKPLTPQELDALLNVDPAAQKKLNITEAILKKDEIEIKLSNGQKIIFGQNSEGLTSIKSSAANGPMDATTAIAMSALAKGQHWKSVDVNGSDMEFRALSFLALQNAGLKMNDPPDTRIIDHYRERFEIALKTGIDPKTAALAEKNAAPVAKSPDPQPVSLKRPAVKTGAPAMR